MSHCMRMRDGVLVRLAGLFIFVLTVNLVAQGSGWQGQGNGVFFGWDMSPNCPVSVSQLDPFGGPALKRVAQGCDGVGPVKVALFAPSGSSMLATVALIVNPGSMAPWQPLGNGGLQLSDGQIWNMNLNHPGLLWFPGGPVPQFSNTPYSAHDQGFLPLNYLPPELRLYGQAVVLDAGAPLGILLGEPSAFLSTYREWTMSVTVPSSSAVRMADVLPGIPTTTWHIFAHGQDVLPGQDWWLNGNGLLTQGGPLLVSSPDPVLFGTLRAMGIWADHGPSVQYSVSVRNDLMNWSSSISGPGWTLQTSVMSMAHAYGFTFDTTSLTGPALVGVSDASGALAPGLPTTPVFPQVGPTGWYETSPTMATAGWSEWQTTAASNPFLGLVHWELCSGGPCN